MFLILTDRWRRDRFTWHVFNYFVYSTRDVTVNVYKILFDLSPSGMWNWMNRCRLHVQQFALCFIYLRPIVSPENF